jgi:hypothetical protein
MFLALIALLQLIRYMTKPTLFRWLTTSLLIAAVALSDLIPFYALTVLMLVAVTTEAIYRNDSAILAFAASFLGALGLIAFQYDLQFVQLSAPAGSATGGAVITALFALPLLVIIVMLIRRFTSRFLTARPGCKAWVFIGFWHLVLGFVLAKVWVSQIPQLAPQPFRYVPEFDVGISLLIGLILWRVDTFSLRFSVSRPSVFPTLRVAWVFGALLVLLSVNALLLLPTSLPATTPATSVVDVPEYRVATWLSQHVTDETVFASGSPAFWLNVFTQVRQIRGGLSQGAINTWWAPVSYQIVAGRSPMISVLWAQAWNVKYIVVTFRNASIYAGDYAYPDKFNSVLPLRYYFGGYGIYEVPLTRPSLVEAISADSASNLPPITGVLDIQDVAAYLQLSQINPNPTAAISYTIPNPDNIQVSVQNATSDTAILLKITYDQRWVAEVNGQVIETTQIGPDFIVAYPRTTGNYQLTLTLNPTVGETLGLYGTVATMIFLAAVTIKQLRPRRRKQKDPETITAQAIPLGKERAHREGRRLQSQKDD